MSHILNKIVVKNFKSIADEEFILSPFTPLVGYNNAGKTNLVEAIKWLLRKSVLQESSFNNPVNAIEMIGEISGINQDILDNLTDGHRNVISPFIQDEKLVIRRTQPNPSCGAPQIRLDVQNQQNIGADNEWRTNPTGIDQAIQALFPEPIHIGAMEDSGEDVSKNKNTTTIGKLLIEILGQIQENHQATIESAFNMISDLLNSEGNQRAAEFIAFDAAVNANLESFFPGVNIKVHVPSPEFKEVLSKGTIKVFENQSPNGKDVTSLGHGAQRSIQMALIRHLAEIKKAGDQHTNTLLLIDEPELYLHPQAIEILREALKSLVNNGYQVVFSTHSPFMITSKDASNTILIRKNPEHQTYKRTSLKAAVESTIQGNPAQATTLFSLSNSSNILFSERVLLAEGKTENKLLPCIVIKCTGRTLGFHKIALVPVDGSGSIKKSMDVLASMDLPTKSVTDLDYALRHGESEGFLPAGDVDIITIKAHLLTIAGQHAINLDNNGWPTKTQTMSAADGFRILANEASVQQNIQNIYEKMLLRNIWIWKKGTIENHLGNISKNEAGWAAFNQRLEIDPLNVILPNNFQEITDFVQWIIA